MHIEQFEVKGLAHYSYLVACPWTRLAAVIDPRRDVDVYLEAATREGWTITHVLETHIHADYASGAVELARRSGAEHAVSAYDRGETHEATFSHRDLHDGDEIELGTVRLRALHTPGHTPEHVSFLAIELPKSGDSPRVGPHPDPLPGGERMKALFSGDFLFAGSLGRPDLLGEDAKRKLAEQLFDSCRTKLAGLPDELVVYPAHGAGSMCGAGMAAKTSTTLGAERVGNPYLDAKLTRAAFVDSILNSVPPFPPYYRRMKKVNAAGARPLGELRFEAIEAAQFRALAESGHTVIDLRGQLPYGAGHVPRSFGIGLDSGLAVWSSWLVPYETPILLIAAKPEDLETAARWLVRVGHDDIRGYLSGGFDAWRTAGYPVASTRQISPADIWQRMQRKEPVHLVDLRMDGEWKGGHAPEAEHIMAGHLADHAAALGGRGEEIALICGSGYRSTAAAGVLERAGVTNVVNVTGGMQAWRAAGLPMTQ